MNNFERAIAIKDEIIKNRRAIHMRPEIGFDLPETKKFVMDKLMEMGYKPVEVGKCGISATVGRGGKTFLLRADMDALPMKEESGVSYASENGYMHACGHDAHMAMLLGAAKLLKENEEELSGTIKLMFQPAEELLTGASNMVENGILNNPTVDAAIAIHISSTTPLSVGTKVGPRFASSNNFRIKITGKGSHGAMPERGVDPVIIGAHIVIGVQELITREIPYIEGATLTMGHFEAGSAVNIIPNEAIIEGTMRTFSKSTQAYLKQRLPEIVKSIAEMYRGHAEFDFLCDCPVMINDPDFSSEIKEYIEHISAGNFDMFNAAATGGSEDFAFIAEKVPASLLLLGAQNPDADTPYPLHNPKMTIDENALPVGTAILVECAEEWLKNNQ